MADAGDDCRGQMRGAEDQNGWALAPKLSFMARFVSRALRAFARDAIESLDDPFESLRDSEATDARPIYPPEILLSERVSPEERSRIIASERSHPKTHGVDHFTVLVLNQLHRLDDPDKMASVTEDQCHRPRTLDKIAKLGYRLPAFHEEVNAVGLQGRRSFLRAHWHRAAKRIEVQLTRHVLNEHLPMYDDHEPTFFDSLAEAALYFEAVVRPLLGFDAAGRLPSDGRVCRRKHLDGDVSAMAFSGLGQWWLRAVVGTGSDASWADRQAVLGTCAPPTGTVAVVDLCGMAEFEVRPGFLPYGAAAFFGADRQLLGIFLPRTERPADSGTECKAGKYLQAAAGRMVCPPGDEGAGGNDAVGDDWAFAQWRFKSSLYWLTFGVFHLVHCHWITSNTLVIATREELPRAHPVRRLVWPFLQNSVTINAKAAVKLAAEQGALVRVSGNTFEGAVRMIEWLSKAWRYETLEQQLARTGLPTDACDAMPFAADGRCLWSIIQRFVTRYLEAFYLPDDAGTSSTAEPPGRTRVADDARLQDFWRTADRAAMDGRTLGLPPTLSLATLAD